MIDPRYPADVFGRNAPVCQIFALVGGQRAGEDTAGIVAISVDVFEVRAGGAVEIVVGADFVDVADEVAGAPAGAFGLDRFLHAMFEIDLGIAPAAAGGDESAVAAADLAGTSGQMVEHIVVVSPRRESVLENVLRRAGVIAVYGGGRIVGPCRRSHGRRDGKNRQPRQPACSCGLANCPSATHPVFPSAF
ncbi:Uncharacterised protein [Bordetella pertussis]|nr:Uncharacterised protein [Bordetella pertussis]